MKESTKRVIDWLTLIPIGFWPALAVLYEFTHKRNDHLSVIWIVLMGINLPFLVASVLWLGLRMDKVPVVHWFAHNIAMHPFRRFLFLCCLVGIVFFIIK